MVAFLVLAAVFTVIELVFGKDKRPRAPRSRWVDVLHFVAARITEVPVGFVGLVVFAVFAIAAGWRGEPYEVWAAAHRSLFARLPGAVQVVVALFVVDFAGYWVHRVQHAPPLWRFHAIHHSSTRLDWLASVRNHPVSELVGRVLLLPPLLLLGIDVRVLATVAPLVGIWAIFLHANVPFRFGLLRYVIATPLFHRWHHSSEPEAHDKNFAGLFPIWDILFGTFYMPDRQPTAFGAAGEEVPEKFLAQLAYPFRRRSGYAPAQWPRSASGSSPICTSVPSRTTTASFGS
jgi:sterol desaturase/sphingolipid hydroxylase (fatty acid hydroxylase superfamily)